MTQSAVFWDRIAERYSRKPIGDEAAYQKKLELTRGYLKPDMKVMEFGCGTGSTAIIHAPHVNSIQAIDISSKMIEIAKQRAAAANVANVTFEPATIQSFSASDESFDAVLGLSILHLLEDKRAAIAKVFRLLKPGGVFVTSTVCIGDTMKWFRLIGPIGRFFGVIPFVSVFTVEELADNMTEAGFEIDYQWQPGKGKAIFLVARKPG